LSIVRGFLWGLLIVEFVKFTVGAESAGERIVSATRAIIATVRTADGLPGGGGRGRGGTAGNVGCAVTLGPIYLNACVKAALALAADSGVFCCHGHVWLREGD